MRKLHLAALLAVALLSACGGGGDNGSTPATAPPPAPAPGPAPVPSPEPEPASGPVFGAQISFGDSLSDVGSYAVGTVKALGGGKFTINGDNTAIDPALTGRNWTELTAARFRLPAPCAAQTGLDGDASQGFSVPVVAHAGCYGYAQGGSRVSNPIGPSHKMTGSVLGGLTVPVRQQIANHLAVSGGRFKPDDMVFVMAGGNDVLFQLAELDAAAKSAGDAAGRQAYFASLVPALAAQATEPEAATTAIMLAIQGASAAPDATLASITQAAIGTAADQPGNAAVGSPGVYGPMVTQANADATAAGQAAGVDYATTHGPELVSAMSAAGAELAGLVKTQILANGAQYVTVNNLPDVASTPAGRSESPQIQALIAAMGQAFNAQLSAALGGEARVLLVDVYALNQDSVARPAAYGLSNVTDTACDMSQGKNALGSSLVCNASNLKAGDVSHYAYADEVHPTPYYYGLLARHVLEKMVARGWL
ncbi:SGNH/GDSL hydrolase family protein [Variovorax sp. UMC13]|uniref:SGNH/GDSL hydrolase family protein n=1 Tax=Variovorax sp. UMC13 TaxID=1862326 RepID=UPI0016026594|nr:SGNH/GDSL hydrolase family protein [Variovorax sp. UMC13]MBB1604694.1 esterase [Variovorax sp. UMC13]